MQRSKIIDGITLTLTIVGAINWGLVVSVLTVS